MRTCGGLKVRDMGRQQDDMWKIKWSDKGRKHEDMWRVKGERYGKTTGEHVKC